MEPPHFGDDEWEDLWRRACEGDRAVWNELCGRLKNVAWKTINKFSNLSEEDRRDVFAIVFMRLYTHIHTINEPNRLPGWIARTSLNESFQMLRRRAKDVPTDTIEDTPSMQAPVEERLLDDERHAAVRLALLKLPPKCQSLLKLWSAGMSQAQIVAETSMAQGSIGPTVRRCLNSLKGLLGGKL